MINEPPRPLDSVIKELDRLKHVNASEKEYWHAREIHPVLGYPDWDSFEGVIEKAKVACITAGAKPDNHFLETSKMVPIGSGAERKVKDYFLSRVGCYLIAMEGYAGKPEIATAKAYFAIQTRLQEIREAKSGTALTDDERRLFLRKEITDHNKKLAGAAKNAGVLSGLDFAIFQNSGYKGQYDGLDAKGRAKKMGLSEKENILDHMGSTELAANLFRATQTEEKLRRDNVKGKVNANNTHYNVGRMVREAIKKIGGTMPEDLPTAPHIKEVEKRLKSGNNELPESED
jgi:DNA-damage-inducible protein D